MVRHLKAMTFDPGQVALSRQLVAFSSVRDLQVSPIMVPDDCPPCDVRPTTIDFIAKYTSVLSELINGTLTSIDAFGGEVVQLESVDCENEFTDLVTCLCGLCGGHL
mmetsp:Transcript_8573/g.14524  ORF Transcript_8573/g.14524 Transcript_8573/m.14524 type:complete len:107 (+) Transcript_8573:924-1244(+)